MLHHSDRGSQYGREAFQQLLADQGIEIGRRGGLFGHLSWHLGLFELHAGNLDGGLRLYNDAFCADDHRGAVHQKLSDSAAFLWRSELAGYPRDRARWAKLIDYAREKIPRPGFSLADWHVALALAAEGDEAALEDWVRAIEELVQAGRYPSGATIPTVARAFERSLSRLSAAGAHIVDMPLPELGEAADMQARCTFPAAEAFSVQRTWVKDHAALYDPRVLARVLRGGTMLAGDYIELQRARADWMRRVNRSIAPFDALLSPTVPMVAPPMADVAPGAERDEAFFAVNARLLRNTALGNLLDGCGLSLPCHCGDELPVGLMLWHGNGRDDSVLHVAQLAERALETP